MRRRNAGHGTSRALREVPKRQQEEEYAARCQRHVLAVVSSVILEEDTISHTRNTPSTPLLRWDTPAVRRNHPHLITRKPTSMKHAKVWRGESTTMQMIKHTLCIGRDEHNDGVAKIALARITPPVPLVRSVATRVFTYLLN